MSRLKIILKLLDLKKFNLERHELDVRKINNDLNLEKERLDSLEREFKDSAKVLKSWHNTTASAREIELFYNYLVELNKKTRDQKEAIQMKSKELEEKKNKMLNVYREKSVLELLLKRIHSKEDKEKSRREQAWIDFLFLSKKVRR
jgi:flagellar export protein FliJ